MEEKMKEKGSVLIVNAMLMMSCIHGVGVFITWDLIPEAIDVLYHLSNRSVTSPDPGTSFSKDVLTLQSFAFIYFFIPAMYAVYIRLALYFNLLPTSLKDPNSDNFFGLFFTFNICQFYGFLVIILVYALHIKLELFLSTAFIFTSFSILVYYYFLICKRVCFRS